MATDRVLLGYRGRYRVPSAGTALRAAFDAAHAQHCGPNCDPRCREWHPDVDELVAGLEAYDRARGAEVRWGVRLEWATGSLPQTTPASSIDDALRVIGNPWDRWPGYKDNPRVEGFPAERMTVVSKVTLAWQDNGPSFTAHEGWARPDLCWRRYDYMQWCAKPPGHDGLCGWPGR